MISKDKHQKHVRLARPAFGDYGRIELGFLGTSCSTIQKMAHQIIHRRSLQYTMAYIDADHKEGDQILAGEGSKDSLMQYPETTELRDKIVFKRLDRRQKKISVFEQREWLNHQDLVLINANHFKAMDQVLIIDPKKPMDKKLGKITRVRVLVLSEGQPGIPDWVKTHLPYWKELPVLEIGETEKLLSFVDAFINERRPSLNGLVLIGGKSSRMKQDKSNLTYHNKSQKDHVSELLQSCCEDVYLSCNAGQAPDFNNTDLIIKDKLIGMGPMGGLISAFMKNPDAAWLTVACDLPFLSAKTLDFLITNRNPSRVATTFLDAEGKFPEPLVTIWEPRAYPVLFRYLSQGYSCPRKVLINSDVEILQAPDSEEFRNVNSPDEYEAALKDLKNQ